MKKLYAKIGLAALTAMLTLGLVPRAAQAAMLYTGSASQVVYVGETFVVEWYLDTQGQVINSMDLRLTFSSDKLEAVEAAAGNSAIDLWVKSPEFDNGQGTMSLIGGVASGVSDSKLNLFRATFRPKETGNARISLAQDSTLLLSDGAGTPAPLVFNEVSFTVNPAEAKPAGVSSSSHPDQEAWYREKEAVITVAPKAGEEYSYSFSSNLEIFPDQNPDDVTQPIKFLGLEDGIYYFKLSSRQGPSQWQEAAVFRVKIDGTPPREFAPAIGQDAAVFEGQPFVSFNSTDSVSGVAYYEVKSGILGKWSKADDGYFKLPGLVLGDTVEVKVVDLAGNERIQSVKVDKSTLNSVFSNPITWVIMIVSFAILLWLVWHYFKLLKKYKVNDN